MVTSITPTGAFPFMCTPTITGPLTATITITATGLRCAAVRGSAWP
jgi:hypothetical protein